MQNAEWLGENGNVIVNEKAHCDVTKFLEFLKTRTNPNMGKDIINYFESQTDMWKNIARIIMGDKEKLLFYEYNPYSNNFNNVVLGDPYHEKLNVKAVFKNSPQSLREIEETTAFRM
jgi:hypothetical protein